MIARRLGGALLAMVLGSSCGGLFVAPSTAPTRSPSPTPSTPPTTVAPSPAPLTSARGWITVSRPLANSRLRSPVTISGDASVFEAALTWRIRDSAGRVLASGTTTATAGAPARGTFSVTATFAAPASDTFAIVEVYEVSPRDGSIDEIVVVPVVITP